MHYPIYQKDERLEVCFGSIISLQFIFIFICVFQETCLCSCCFVVSGAWHCLRPCWNLHVVMFWLDVRMHQPSRCVYARARHHIVSCVTVSLCSLGNGSGCLVKLVRRSRKWLWRGCSFRECVRACVRVCIREKLWTYKGRETLLQEVLFPLNKWHFRLRFTVTR